MRLTNQQPAACSQSCHHSVAAPRSQLLVQQQAPRSPQRVCKGVRLLSLLHIPQTQVQFVCWGVVSNNVDVQMLDTCGWPHTGSNNCWVPAVSFPDGHTGCHTWDHSQTHRFSHTRVQGTPYTNVRVGTRLTRQNWLGPLCPPCSRHSSRLPSACKVC